MSGVCFTHAESAIEAIRLFPKVGSDWPTSPELQVTRYDVTSAGVRLWKVEWTLGVAKKLRYAISLDEERFEGDFETVEEAIAEAQHGHGLDTFWVGRKREPRQPESFIDADNIIDSVGDGDEDWSGDYADWDRPTREQIAELQKMLELATATWLDEYKLRPTWFCCSEIEKYSVVDGKAEVA